MDDNVTQRQPGSSTRRTDVGIIAFVPDEWHGPWSTRHHVLSRLARHFTVIWMDPPRGWRDWFAPVGRDSRVRHGFVAESGGVLVYRPRWLVRLYNPRPIATMLERLRLWRARRMLRRRGCRKTILYIWRPEFAPVLELMALDLSCYHIDDEYSFSESDTPLDAREERLIRRVDQVIVHSPALLEKKGHLNPHTIWIPNGVDYVKYATLHEEPADLRNIPHPRVGYVGVIKKQLDIPLLLALARRYPLWSFVMVGPIGNIAGQEKVFDEFKRLPNVYMLGSKPVDQLPAYLQHVDVCPLCYVVNDYTKYIYPLKFHECLAAGRPVVSSPIRSLLEFGHVVEFACGAEEWSRALTAALSRAEQSSDRMQARRAVARQYDWDGLVEKIACSLCERLDSTTGTTTP